MPVKLKHVWKFSNCRISYYNISITRWKKISEQDKIYYQFHEFKKKSVFWNFIPFVMFSLIPEGLNQFDQFFVVQFYGYKKFSKRNYSMQLIFFTTVMVVAGTSLYVHITLSSCWNEYSLIFVIMYVSIYFVSILLCVDNVVLLADGICACTFNCFHKI